MFCCVFAALIYLIDGSIAFAVCGDAWNHLEAEGRFFEEAYISPHQPCAADIFHSWCGVERGDSLVCIEAP